MPDDSLGPDARALWQRVADTVRPLKGRRRAVRPVSVGAAAEKPSPVMAAIPVAKQSVPKPKSPPAPVKVSDTLDGGWDRRLRRGVVSPDATIDLHGYTLSAAHAALEAQLGAAIARHSRLILLVTGRPPPPGRSRLENPLRGVIRASIGDWLHHSAHARHIAAVRSAHPRHGGAGALYIILKRARG